MTTAAVKSRTPAIGLAILNFAFPNWGDDANENMVIIDALMAALNITQLRGTWEPLTDYVVGERVIDDLTFIMYQCAVSHTSGGTTFAADRAAHPTFWTSLTVVNYLPLVDDTTDLGAATHRFGNLFLKNTGTLNFNNGAWVLSQNGSTGRFSGTVTPVANDGGALGTATLSFSDAFLASGGVVNWNNGAYTLTQAGSILTASGQFNANAFSTANIIDGGTVTGAMIASQAQMESGSATNLIVTPGRQMFHPSAAKIWGVANGAGTTLLANFGVSSITDVGTGSITFNFGATFSSGNYAALGTIADGNSRVAVRGTAGTGSCNFLCLTDTNTAADPATGYSVAFFGDYI